MKNILNKSGLKVLLFAAMSAIFADSIAQEETTTLPNKSSTTRRVVKYEPDPSKLDVLYLSTVKVNFIKEVVKSYVDAKAVITDQTVINMIYDQIEKEFVIQPKGKPDNDGPLEIRRKALAEISGKFPMDEAQKRASLEAAAKKIYANSKEGEKITLTYTKGTRRYRITDIFYKFNGNTVSIGLKTIPFIDLIEEDKIRVSPAYAKYRQDEYIKKELTSYLDARQDALLFKESEIRNKQLKGNISRGFVRFAEEWRYPIQVINYYLIESIEADQRYAGKFKGLSLDSIQRIQIKDLGNTIDKKDLFRRIQRRAEDAAKLVGTIDTDQGFLNILFWGFSKAEVKLVIEEHGMNFIPGKEYDRVFLSDRQIKETRLYYKNERLSSVVTIYNISEFKAFTELKRNMLKKYGVNDETKQKKFVRPGDPISWTGIITDGFLNVKQDPKSGNLEGDVTMTLKMVPLEEREKRANLKESK